MWCEVKDRCFTWAKNVFHFADAINASQQLWSCAHVNVKRGAPAEPHGLQWGACKKIRIRNKWDESPECHCALKYLSCAKCFWSTASTLNFSTLNEWLRINWSRHTICSCPSVFVHPVLCCYFNSQGHNSSAASMLLYERLICGSKARHCRLWASLIEC